MFALDGGFAAGFKISGSFIEESVESDCSELKPGLENILPYQFSKTCEWMLQVGDWIYIVWISVRFLADAA